MLWDIIRDFFVENIFGGRTSEGNIFSGYLGSFADSNFSYFDCNNAEFYVPIGNAVNGLDDSIVSFYSLGDWLSTTATIIVLIALCFFLYLVLRYIFKLFGGLFAH